jgi:HD-GYP domain-containing protein (c-di-GMP phosphodiesterase class II)
MVRRLTASGERAETGGGERVAETEGPLVDRITREEFSQFLSETLSSQDQFALERLIGAEKTPFYADLATYVLGCIRGAEAGQPIDVDRGVWLAEGIVRFVDQGPDLLLAATDREQEFSVTGHSVNVAILAARLGYTLRLPSDVRARVGATALLHEVGVVRLPKRLVHKPEKIAKEELQTMRSRPQLSALILREGGDAPDWLAETVEQVFERENGSGFPRGLSSKDIREEAKLLAGADVFEACIHNRPYRKALTGYQSLLELTTEGSKSLAEKVVKALIRCFSLYPYNELVVLNTGEIGKVINVHEGNISRPVVEILFDGRGRPVSEGKVTDLAQNSSLYITRVTVADQLPAVDASIEE